MPRRRRTSVLGPLLTACSVAAVLVALAIGAEYVAVTGQSATTNQVTGHYLQLQRYENILENDFGTAEFSIIYFSATGKRAFVSADYYTSAHRYSSDLANVRRMSTPNVRGLTAIQATALNTWFHLAGRIIAAQPRSPAAKRMLTQSSALNITFAAANAASLARVHDSITQQAIASKQSLARGLVLSVAALAVAVLLVLAASLSTLYTVSRPLRRLTGTVRRLTAGDHSARSLVSGSGEVQEVAAAVNTLADESDRLREREAESDRLRELAREVGLRIRQHLAAGKVLHEAQTGLRQVLDTDVITLRLVEDGRVTGDVTDEPGERPAEPADALPAVPLERLRELFQRQTSLVVEDLRLVTPFGVGADPLGVIVAQRERPGSPWTAAEVDAVESIAADLGRGMNDARLYEAENRLVADLRGLDQVKSEFFATVSHELRAPLTTIEGYVEILGDGEGGEITPEQRRMLDTVTRSSVRLREMVENLFTLAKLESGSLPAVMTPVSVAEVIASARAAVRDSADTRNVRLTSPSPGHDLVVAGDAGQLEQVLVNLLSNAVKYTPEGGRVEVSAVGQDGSAVIAVSDTGIGIPARDQQGLFTRFARASNATARRIPGTGLGLVIVRTIITNHGGDVRLDSEEDQGTTITVRLPLHARDRNPQPVG